MNDGRIRPGKIALEQAQRKALAAEKAAAFAQKKHLWALQELKAAKAKHAATLHHIEMEAYRRQYNKRANRRRMRSPKAAEFENITFISAPKETPRMTKTAKLRIHVCSSVRMRSLYLCRYCDRCNRNLARRHRLSHMNRVIAHPHA